MQRRAIKCYRKAAHVQAYSGPEFQHPAAAAVSRLLPRNSNSAGDKRRRAADEQIPRGGQAAGGNAFWLLARLHRRSSFAKSPNFSNIRGRAASYEPSFCGGSGWNGGAGPALPGAASRPQAAAQDLRTVPGLCVGSLLPALFPLWCELLVGMALPKAPAARRPVCWACKGGYSRSVAGLLAGRACSVCPADGTAAGAGRISARDAAR